MYANRRNRNAGRNANSGNARRGAIKSLVKRKLKKLAALYAAGRINAKTVEQSYQSWRGHAEKGNSYHLIWRTDQYYNSLMKSKEAAQCQKH